MTAAEIDPAAARAVLPATGTQMAAVEHTRAAAEVAAAVYAARANPRDVQRAITEMQEACSLDHVANRAFYTFPRDGRSITGPTVHLARELGRIWGNVQFGIVELSRPDGTGQSEMLAFAWDVQANTRCSNGFVAEHTRDAKDPDGRKIRKPLEDQRDIYENNANLAARRLRECILDVLPQWFVAAAVERCHATLKHGGGKPLQERIADALRRFEEEFGVTREQLEAKTGRQVEAWSDVIVANLVVLFQTLGRGETTADAEFPPAALTAAELNAHAERAAAAAPARRARGGKVTPATDTDQPDDAEIERQVREADPT